MPREGRSHGESGRGSKEKGVSKWTKRGVVDQEVKRGEEPRCIESTWELRRHIVKMDELNRNQKLGEEVKSRPWWDRFRPE